MIIFIAMECTIVHLTLQQYLIILVDIICCTLLEDLASLCKQVWLKIKEGLCLPLIFFPFCTSMAFLPNANHMKVTYSKYVPNEITKYKKKLICHSSNSTHDVTTAPFF